ncbi:AMPK1_CBM domain-containing protein [Psidium guajava]|nr:AMPK1_CBM domain-containing protein [Psidium guajava]
MRQGRHSALVWCGHLWRTLDLVLGGKSRWQGIRRASLSYCAKMRSPKAKEKQRKEDEKRRSSIPSLRFLALPMPKTEIAHLESILNALRSRFSHTGPSLSSHRAIARAPTGRRRDFHKVV